RRSLPGRPSLAHPASAREFQSHAPVSCVSPSKLTCPPSTELIWSLEGRHSFPECRIWPKRSDEKHRGPGERRFCVLLHKHRKPQSTTKSVHLRTQLHLFRGV